MLYKYTTLDSLNKILDSERLHFSSFWQLNDQHEATAITNYGNKEVKINYRKVVRTLSLSKKCDIPSMWAYYAKNNEGICIGFDENLLEFDLCGKYKKLDIYDVNYCDNIPNDGVINANQNTFEGRKKIKRALATKGKSWCSENESRIFLFFDEFIPDDFFMDAIDNCEDKIKFNKFDGNSDAFYSSYEGGLNVKFNPESLKEIIFGTEVSGPQKLKIINKVRTNGFSDDIKYYHLISSRNKFAIDIVPEK